MTSITATSEKRLAHPLQTPLHLGLPTPLATSQTQIMDIICTQFSAVLRAYIPIPRCLATGASRRRLVRPRLSNLLVCHHRPPQPPHSIHPRRHVSPSVRPPLNLNLVRPLSSPLASSLATSSTLTQTDSQSSPLCEFPTVSHYAILISNWCVFFTHFIVHRPSLPRLLIPPFFITFHAGACFSP